MPYGYTQTAWDSAKAEARNVMIERARKGDVISYSDLAANIKTIDLEAHDQRLFQLLGEVSTEEDALGHGMLSAVVVHKTDDERPGQGFFELAKSLGRDTSDIEECWNAELKRVYAAWSIKAE